jgi:hypothetical protein
MWRSVSRPDRGARTTRSARTTCATVELLTAESNGWAAMTHGRRINSRLLTGLAYTLMTGGGAFALGGVGPALLAVVVAGTVTAIAARSQPTSDRQSPDETTRSDTAAAPSAPTRAKPGRDQPAARFRRGWLLCVAAVAGAVPLAYAAGSTVGTVILVSGLLMILSGAVALIVMMGGPSG